MRFLIAVLIMILGMMVVREAEAQDYQLLDVERLTIEHKKILGKRDPLFPNKSYWTKRTNLLWDVEVYETFFWKNNVYMDMDYAVRHIGWHFRYGFHVTKWFDVVCEHHSRHAADRDLQTPSGKFPVEDSCGGAINFVTE